MYTTFFVQLQGVEVHNGKAVEKTALPSCSAMPTVDLVDERATQGTISLSQSPPSCSQVDLTSSQDSPQFVAPRSSNVSVTATSVPEGTYTSFLN